MTPEEKLIVNRLKATYADVDEMQKVFDIVTKTLSVREAEIEQLKALLAQAADVLKDAKAAIQAQKIALGDLRRLLTRAADVLEVYLSTAAGGTRHPFIAELRKAAE